MKAKPTNSRHPAPAAVIYLAGSARAASGTWTADSSTNWSATGSWSGGPCHHNEDYAEFRRKGTIFLALLLMKFKTLPISLSFLLMECADATAPCRTP